MFCSGSSSKFGSKSGSELSHIDAKGEAAMVDVSNKKVTSRTAMASGIVVLGKEVMEAIKKSGSVSKKGDVVTVSKVAGIMAAKSTSSLIPMAHQVPLSHVSVDIELDYDQRTAIVICTTKTSSQTGVEMEALTGVTVACLTLYDMCKAVNKGIVIKEIKLINKTGGQSDFTIP